jgi:hypothetical protein
VPGIQIGNLHIPVYIQKVEILSRTQLSTTPHLALYPFNIIAATKRPQRIIGFKENPPRLVRPGAGSF